MIAVVDNELPIGQIRFDRTKSSRDEKTDEVLIDISLDRCARGFGLASQVIMIGLRLMRKKWGNNIDAVAEILSSNKVSQATFERAGFTEESEIKKRNQINSILRYRNQGSRS